MVDVMVDVIGIDGINHQIVVIYMGNIDNEIYLRYNKDDYDSLNIYIYCNMDKHNYKENNPYHIYLYNVLYVSSSLIRRL